MAAVSLGLVIGTRGVVTSLSMVRMGANAVHMLTTVQAMVRVTGSGREPTRLARFRAQHRCSNRPPKGQQHANQQQNEDAKNSHKESLADPDQADMPAVY